MCVFTQKMVTFTLRVSIKVYVCMNSGGLNITALLGDLFTLTMYFCDLCNLPFNIINLLHWKYASPVRPLWLERVDFKYKVKGRLVKIRVRDEKKTYNVSPTGVKITSFAKSLHTTLFTWMIDSVQSHNPATADLHCCIRRGRHPWPLAADIIQWNGKLPCPTKVPICCDFKIPATFQQRKTRHTSHWITECDK